MSKELDQHKSKELANYFSGKKIKMEFDYFVNGKLVMQQKGKNEG